ncbi:MAG: type IV secretory system conjugative DNA transfer family protein [Frankiaceae bacterium]
MATEGAPARWLWRRIIWVRPLDEAKALALLRQLAADQRSPRLVLEARASQDEVSWLLGCPAAALDELAGLLNRLLPGTLLQPLPAPREPAMVAGRLRASTRHRPLRTDTPLHTTRSLLGALMAAQDSGELVVQVVLGPRRVPLAIPTRSPAATVRPWWDALWSGQGRQLDSEKRTALRAKVGDHGFACTVRLGVRAGTPAQRRRLLLGLLAAVRTSEASGVVLRLVPERPARLNAARRPWRWPLRLNVAEVLTLLGWPLGEEPLPGVADRHPRLMPAVRAVMAHGRVVGQSAVPGDDRALGLSAQDALLHLHVIGPTGTGKSTLLANLIVQDIAAGRGVAVVDGKGDLVSEVLARVPAERHDDVVLLDAADREAPVGLNPLQRHRATPPEVIADGVLAVLHDLYADAWGPRTQDILHASLLTLARRRDASLVMLPLLLTNPGFRRSLTAHLDDPLGLSPFWAWYEGLSEQERQAVIAPTMNRLRPFLLRPSLRAVLGQVRPRFNVRQVFTERRVLLVNLAKGTVGSEAAALLGSLVVAQLWQATTERAAVPAARRHPVMVYVDEVQDYLHLPTDLTDVLTQARGFGVGLTLAHQHLAQLPPAMRAALANARSRVCFQLAQDDAAVLARGGDLEPVDFVSLPRFHAYASLVAHGQVTPYAALRTLPLTEPCSDPTALQAASRARWGQPLDEIEAGFAALLHPKRPVTDALGRRPRRPA